MKVLRVALCPVVGVVGDFDGNVRRILQAVAEAERDGCDLIVLPGSAIGGASLGDLARDRSFLAAHDRAAARVAAAAGDGTILIGGLRGGPGPTGVVHEYRRDADPVVHGPGADSGVGVVPVDAGTIGGVRVAVTTDPRIPDVPDGTDLVVVCDADGFRPGRAARWAAAPGGPAAPAGVAIVRVNLLGATDGTVFDGGATLHAADGSLVVEAPRFAPGVVVADLVVPDGDVGAGPGPADTASARTPAPQAPAVVPLEGEAELWTALTNGLGAYVSSGGFTDVVLGLSGGVDSALVATIATDTVGPDRVHAVAMPSRYSTPGSVTDAERLAGNLGIDLRTIPIEPAHAAFTTMLGAAGVAFDGGVTEQNVQARIRGVLVMALSNEFGWLVLACGNKSEAAVGYSTLYGDSVGGLSVIGDVYKTDVYALCRWRNRAGDGPVIPESILTKAPSAELAPGQRDDASLPPYPLLDAMLRDHVEGGLGIDELIAAGHPPEEVRRVVALVRRAEYKRRQAPLSIVVSDRSFVADRRFPLTNAFEGRASGRDRARQPDASGSA